MICIARSLKSVRQWWTTSLLQAGFVIEQSFVVWKYFLGG
jgi:hypothetical protein